MTEVLSNLSDGLAEAVETAGRGIVRVEGRKRLPASGVVWSADGAIVTAHHVVEQDTEISVGLHDGRVVPAILVGRDPTTDLAVLRAQVGGLTPPTWAEPEGVRVGHLALAIGRPGQDTRATLGIVSALGPGWHTPAGGRLDHYLQTDIVMYPGFSGGPLVNARGRFLGVNTSALARGVSVAIPAPTLRRVVESLLSHGRIRRGYLGVGSQPVRLSSNLAQQLNQETGLLLVSVASGSPAEEHGLLMGDAIVSLEGQAVRHADDLLALLGDDRIGKAASVRIVRGGQVQEISVTVGEHS